MQFVLMCCIDETSWEGLPDAQRQQIMEDYAKFEQEIANNGHFIASVKLGSSTAAATLRETNGRRVATDGPFAETKEQLGGLHLIECRDRAEAMAIAERIPTFAAGGVVEVRPVEFLTQR